MLKENLEQRVAMFDTMKFPSLMERFVLRNSPGEMTGIPFDDELGEPKMCFMNATHLSLETHVEYFEGYCMRDDLQIPFHHAWCVDDGMILDPTLKEPERYHYLGVEIPKPDLRAELAKSGYYGILDNGMINYGYMFKRDPELKEIAERIMGRAI
jgi:hypothetical protein